MKKALILGLFGMMALASCKKDYTCTCTTTATDGSGNTSSSSASTTINDTKKNAEASCNEGDESYALGGSSYVIDCEI